MSNRIEYLLAQEILPTLRRIASALEKLAGEAEPVNVTDAAMQAERDRQAFSEWASAITPRLEAIGATVVFTQETTAAQDSGGRWFQVPGRRRLEATLCNGQQLVSTGKDLTDLRLVYLDTGEPYYGLPVDAPADPQ